MKIVSGGCMGEQVRGAGRVEVVEWAAEKTSEYRSGVAAAFKVLVRRATSRIKRGGKRIAPLDVVALAGSAAAAVAGVVLLGKGAKLWQLRSLPLGIARKLRAPAGSAALKTIRSGVYVIRAFGRSYAGQSGQIERRVPQHRAKRFTPKQIRRARRLEVLEQAAEGSSKSKREIVEQCVLDSLGGKKSRRTENRVDPIGGRPDLGKPRRVDDLVTNVAVSALPLTVYAAVAVAIATPIYACKKLWRGRLSRLTARLAGRESEPPAELAQTSESRCEALPPEVAVEAAGTPPQPVRRQPGQPLAGPREAVGNA